jgi:hypothetical protein
LNDLELKDEVVFAKFHPALVDALRERFAGRSFWLYTAKPTAREDTLVPWDPAVVPAAVPTFFPPDNFDGFDFARPFAARSAPVPSLEAP